jgi:hypothetical protein
MKLRNMFMSAVALLTALTLSLGLGVQNAQAQVLTDVVLDLTTDIQVSEECAEEGCRNVTFDAILGVSADGAVDITEVANLLVGAAVFQFEVTDAAGNTVGVFGAGDTVCLEPGSYTVTTTIVNVSELEALIAPLGFGIDADASVLSSTETLVVPECPVDGDPGVPGDDPEDPGAPGTPGDVQYGGPGNDIITGDTTVGQCLAIINNTGVQYDATIIQECNQVINNFFGGDPDAGDPTGDDPADSAGGNAFTLNAQTCAAFFGDQDATQIQYGSDGSFQGLSQTQVQYCLQVIENVTAGGSAVVDDHNGEVVHEDNVEVVVEEHTGIAGTPGLVLLPDTGGASLLVLGTGALLVAGGLLARRVTR